MCLVGKVFFGDKKHEVPEFTMIQVYVANFM